MLSDLELKNIFLFPVRDEYARKQFLLASLVVLVGMFIPILPILFLMGYAARISRQIIDEEKDPVMPEWTGSDWGEMLMDGLRLFGVRLIYTLPFMALFGCGFIFMFASPIFLASSAETNSNPLSMFGGLSMMAGMGVFMLAMLILLPLTVILEAVDMHVIAKRSFNAGFQYKDWWKIFRNGLTLFILAYVMTLVVNMILSFVLQFLMLTVVLICVLPIIMPAISAYVFLVMYAFSAKAYSYGLKAPQAA